MYGAFSNFSSTSPSTLVYTYKKLMPWLHVSLTIWSVLPAVYIVLTFPHATLICFLGYTNDSIMVSTSFRFWLTGGYLEKDGGQKEKSFWVEVLE